MKRKQIWLIAAVALLAVIVLAPASVLAFEKPGPGTLLPDAETYLRIVGEIESKDDTIPGVWVVDGQTIQVTGETAFLGNPVTMNVGATVEVIAEDRDGELYAVQIRKVQAPTEVHFQGTIEEMADDYWVVDGTTVLITSATRILGASPDVGDYADVRAREDGDDLVATRIFVVDIPQNVRFHGIIAEMNEDSWVITTLVGDQTVAITEDTVIQGGDPDVGDIAKVWATVTDGGLVADRIMVEDVPVEVHFRGVINEVGDDYWVVGMRTVLITEDTVLEGDEPDVGDFAEVWGEATLDGLAATRIIVTDKPQPGIVRGIVDSIEGDVWTISGIEVVTTEDTVIVGNPDVGDQVVAVVDNQDGTLVAHSIHKVPDPQRPAHFGGIITEIVSPENEGDPAIWTVESTVEHNGQTQTWTVLITEDTEIVGKGEPAVGAWVKGFGDGNEDGSITATLVRVTPPPKVPFMGPIEQMPEDGVVGAWVVGGVSVTVTEDTRVIGDPADWGDNAKGYGTLQADGSVEALVIGPMPTWPG